MRAGSATNAYTTRVLMHEWRREVLEPATKRIVPCYGSYASQAGAGHLYDMSRPQFSGLPQTSLKYFSNIFCPHFEETEGMDDDENIFATLTPVDVEAKLAFDAAYERSQQDPAGKYSQHMFAKAERVFDSTVYRNRAGNSDSDSDDSFNDAIDDASRELGMIWKGHYKFDLDSPPLNSSSGWSAGRGRVGTEVDIEVDILIVDKRLKPIHLLFQIHHQTGQMYLISKSNFPRVEAEQGDGPTTVLRDEIFAFNWRSGGVEIGTLRYRFEYNAQFVEHRRFYSRRRKYMIDIGVCAPDFRHTPRPFTQVHVGNFCLSEGLGKGLSGKVYAAFNSKAQLVAIKTLRSLHKPSTASSIQKIIDTLTILTKLAVENDDEGRLLHLRKVIKPAGQVMLVLEPVVDCDFRHLIDIGKDRTGLQVSPEKNERTC
jgi:hypothetical protein